MNIFFKNSITLKTEKNIIYFCFPINNKCINWCILGPTDLRHQVTKLLFKISPDGFKFVQLFNSSVNTLVSVI